MDEVASIQILDGITIGKRSRTPILMLHAPKHDDASALADAMMCAGGSLVDIGRLRRLPRFNKNAHMWIGSNRIRLDLHRGDGTAWSYKWLQEIDASWRQSCFDQGGVLAVILAGTDSEYLEKIVNTDVSLGTVLSIAPAVFFPRD